MALITFDLDGVLQRNPFRKGVFPHIYSMLAPESAGDAGGGAEPAVAGRIRAEFARRQLAGEWVESYNWDAIVATVAAEVGYTGNLISVARLVESYCTPEYIFSHPGAHEALGALAAAGHTLKVVTNGFAAYQEPVINALGLYGFFSAVITPERAGTSKPWPAAFHAAGPPPALHVGDTLIHDIYGANMAGFAGCWMTPDLPEGWGGLDPLQRAAHPDLPEILAERLAIERRWHPAPPVETAQCRPAYVVASLSEVPDTVAHWCRSKG